MVCDKGRLSPDYFISSAKKFVAVSDKINDKWKLIETGDICKSYIAKETYIIDKDTGCPLHKAEFIIFYNLSYGVPSFSFNIRDSTGSLLSLEDVREMSLIRMDEKEFYSVITQQEHPILCRPYFVMHPCHTQTLLENFKESKNIIVTFLGLVMPLLNLNLPLEYGL